MEIRGKYEEKTYANKIVSSNGIWYYYIDEKHLCYLILTDPNYNKVLAI